MPITICSSVSGPPGSVTFQSPRPITRGLCQTQIDIAGEHDQREHGQDAVDPGRQLIDGARRVRRVDDAEAEHGGVAEPEGQAGNEADLGDLDRVEPERRIDAIAHRAAGEDAGADIVADRIAGEAGERGGRIGNVVAPDRAQREQIVKGQREIAGGDEQRGQHDVRAGWRAEPPPPRQRRDRATCGRAPPPPRR